MKVLLARPYNKMALSVSPPIGLGYLASMLKVKGGHEVFLYDAVRHNLPSVDSFHDFLKTIQPDVVGIQLFSVDLQVVKQYLRCVKNIDPGIITVVGGPHPSALPEETMEYFGPVLDYAIAGEGEKGLLELVNHLGGEEIALDKINGLVWRNKAGRTVTNDNLRTQELDDLPWPDWKLMDPSHYPHAPLGGFSRAFPVAPVLISRGCPLRCTFCAARSIYGSGFRYRKIDDVIAEIRYLITEHGIREIIILDDNFTVKKNVVMEFCQKIRPLHIHWNCLNGVHLNWIDEEMVKAMKDAGCHIVAVGVESGSQKILNDMNKNLTIETVREKIRLFAKHHISVSTEIIVGYPTETRDDILSTIALLKSLPIDRAAIACFVPLPGSKIYNDLKKQGKLDGVNLGDLSFYNITKSFSPHLSDDELSSLHKKAVRSVHLRPRVLLKAFRNIGSFANFIHLAKRFITMSR